MAAADLAVRHLLDGAATTHDDATRTALGRNHARLRDSCTAAVANMKEAERVLDEVLRDLRCGQADGPTRRRAATPRAQPPAPMASPRAARRAAPLTPRSPPARKKRAAPPSSPSPSSSPRAKSKRVVVEEVAASPRPPPGGGRGKDVRFVRRIWR